MVWRSIVTKSLIIVLLLSTLPLALFGYRNITIYQKEKRDSIINAQREKAVLVGERTQGF